MISYIEALEALAATGTMGKAGLRLRLSQSAISKRIAALEDAVGEALIVREGRRVVLTSRGVRLLQRIQPLVAEMRAAISDESQIAAGLLTVGVSESILGSWGPSFLKSAKEQLPDIRLNLHAHRSPAVVDRVAAGEYTLGLIAGEALDTKGLVIEPLFEEPMVLILGAKGGKAFDRQLIAIEERSGTWSSISLLARRSGLIPTLRLESFFAVAQLAQSGFGDGLVPIGVAKALNLKSTAYKEQRGLARPISLIARRQTSAQLTVSAFVSALIQRARRSPDFW